MIADAVAVIVIISSCVQLGYCFYFFSRIFKYRQLLKGTDIQSAILPEFADHPVSVIICAKNEAHNLQNFLPALLEQNYHNRDQVPEFEVIVVDDQSDDDTATVLSGVLENYNHLKVVTIPADEIRTLPGKKFALSKGLAAASFDHIIMTDADCKPAGNLWIALMNACFSDRISIVGGYGGYYEHSSLVNLFSRCETIHTYLQYFTYNLAGHPYMAVGRNLAVKKELLLRAQEHPLWKEMPSGDDDLLIQLCATKENMKVLADPGTATWSDAKESWKSWIGQKQRHVSTGKLYKPEIKLLLGGYALSHALFWVSLAAALIILPEMKPVIYLFALLRCIVFWRVCFSCSNITTDRRLSFFWPVFDIGWLLYNVIFAPYIFWKNKQQWK